MRRFVAAGAVNVDVSENPGATRDVQLGPASAASTVGRAGHAGFTESDQERIAASAVGYAHAHARHGGLGFGSSAFGVQAAVPFRAGLPSTQPASAAQAAPVTSAQPAGAADGLAQTKMTPVERLKAKVRAQLSDAVQREHSQDDAAPTAAAPIPMSRAAAADVDLLAVPTAIEQPLGLLPSSIVQGAAVQEQHQPREIAIAAIDDEGAESLSNLLSAAVSSAGAVPSGAPAPAEARPAKRSRWSDREMAVAPTTAAAPAPAMALNIAPAGAAATVTSSSIAPLHVAVPSMTMNGARRVDNRPAWMTQAERGGRAPTAAAVVGVAATTPLLSHPAELPTSFPPAVAIAGMPAHKATSSAGGRSLSSFPNSSSGLSVPGSAASAAASLSDLGLPTSFASNKLSLFSDDRGGQPAYVPGVTVAAANANNSRVSVASGGAWVEVPEHLQQVRAPAVPAAVASQPSLSKASTTAAAAGVNSHNNPSTDNERIKGRKSTMYPPGTPLFKALRVGDVVEGLWSGDGSWYRAEVTSITHQGYPNAVYKVLFIDYGNKEDGLSSDRLRLLPGSSYGDLEWARANPLTDGGHSQKPPHEPHKPSATSSSAVGGVSGGVVDDGLANRYAPGSFLHRLHQKMAAKGSGHSRVDGENSGRGHGDSGRSQPSADEQPPPPATVTAAVTRVQGSNSSARSRVDVASFPPPVTSTSSASSSTSSAVLKSRQVLLSLPDEPDSLLAPSLLQKQAPYSATGKAVAAPTGAVSSSQPGNGISVDHTPAPMPSQNSLLQMLMLKAPSSVGGLPASQSPNDVAAAVTSADAGSTVSNGEAAHTAGAADGGAQPAWKARFKK